MFYLQIQQILFNLQYLELNSVWLSPPYLVREPEELIGTVVIGSVCLDKPYLTCLGTRRIQFGISFIIC